MSPIVTDEFVQAAWNLAESAWGVLDAIDPIGPGSRELRDLELVLAEFRKAAEDQ